MHIADLHIHSRYSRATSKDCTPEYLDLWARKKGIHLVGTGDFTHPAWREELKDKLEPAEDGLYRLKKEYRLEDSMAGASKDPRFVITGEISTIYKKNDKTRKVHSVILLPGLEEAEALSKRLESIGNIHSDGRPILGLDCRDLLEITLEACPDSIYIPAHIWTPHFSLFGAFSGFDTIEECYEDLTPHIHALETGLSSDPPMNWRLSALDGYQLISNSDAHSPQKLGREANLLGGELSYQGLYKAVQTGEGLEGTIEFFPEEGKYHFDGHRKCHLCLSPSEVEKYQGKCPVCGRKLTTGVLHRVEQLADREEDYLRPKAKHFESLVPLPEVVAACTGQSAAGVKTLRLYEDMLKKLGPEFSILRQLPIEDIRHTAGPLVAEGIKRLREGHVERNPGFDGEYGTIKLLEKEEMEALNGQMSLFSVSEWKEMAQAEAAASKEESLSAFRSDNASSLASNDAPAAAALEAKDAVCNNTGSSLQGDNLDVSSTLDPSQEQAVHTPGRALAVIAGPGTGKTRTLISRILYLLQERKVKPGEITAVTFTNQAADEMKERLLALPSGKRIADTMQIGTFHAICSKLLTDSGIQFTLADELAAADLAEETIVKFKLPMKSGSFLKEISLLKTGLKSDTEKLPSDAVAWYQKRLADMGLMDFDDLLINTLKLANVSPDVFGKRFNFLLVDEFQDISPMQYDLIRAWNLAGKELFVIGDPDQAIYGFRGSDSRCFEKLSNDFEHLTTIKLTNNYRSAAPILDCALSVISHNPGPVRTLSAASKVPAPPRMLDGSAPAVRLITAQSGLSEGIAVAKEINRLIGGIDMLDAHDLSGENSVRKSRGFSDIAVLYRTHRQAETLEMCLRKEGIPYVVAGRDDFLMDHKVRGMVSFFRWLMNEEDDYSKELYIRLLLKDGEASGEAAMQEQISKLRDKYKKMVSSKKPQKILDAFVQDLKLDELDAVKKFVNMSVFHNHMGNFLDSLAFGQEGDLKRSMGKSYASDTVTLMTLHGAKGLEFPYVFLCGLKQGVIPLEFGKAGNRETDIEEERRLFYVGMTRAKEQLVMLTSGEPSVFLTELPEDVPVKESFEKKQLDDEVQQISLFDLM